MIIAFQIEVLLRELRDTYKKFSHPKDGKPRDITTIVTGDFNSNPYTGVIDLLTKGTVPSYHSDWFTCKPFISGHVDFEFKYTI